MCIYNMLIDIHMYIYIYIYMCIYVYICTYIYIYVRVFTFSIYMCIHERKYNLILILIAFITGNSSLEPLIEGLCAQIHVNLR